MDAIEVLDDKALVKHPGGRPPKWTEADNGKLNILIDKYMEDCKQQSIIPTITGLALVLDCDMNTICEYSKKPEFFSSIKRAYNICFNHIYQGMLTAKNPAGYIFAAKNFGMTDTQQIDHTVTQKIITVDMIGNIDD